MKTHQTIDDRGLALARRIVEKIDADPDRKGLEHARMLCEKWFKKDHLPAYAEWKEILSEDWKDIRGVLLDETEDGRRLRQNSPFCGVLTPEERIHIFRLYSHE